jgi:hypothetical protein
MEGMSTRKCNPVLLAVAGLILLGSGGCDETRPAAPVSLNTSCPEASSQFDQATAGIVSGQVVWSGTAPVVSPFHAPVSPFVEQRAHDWRDWPNPHAPVIDPKSGGVRDAVVFLRGVDPRRSKPWDLPPVEVELRDYQIRVRQGPALGKYGIIRQGARVEMASRQSEFFSLHAAGAEFFTFAFADQDQVVARRLDHRGLIELTSASGYFWARAYLFVDDHPYYTLTDVAGRFRLTQVPPGRYEMVCWLPNWKVRSHDRDLETCYLVRVAFEPPLQLVQEVEVAPGAAVTVSFQASGESFTR